MIENVVTSYQKMQLSIIHKFSGEICNIIEEAGFYDEGYLYSKIERLKIELSRVSEELKCKIKYEKDSDYTNKILDNLQCQREKLVFDLLFLASNSFKSLDACFGMLNQYPYDFIDCVKALKAYDCGKENEAFELLESYYLKKGSVEGHYLINKTFGILLMKRERYEQAIRFLRYALKLMPDDLEIHIYLAKLYEKRNQNEEKLVEYEIINLLGGVLNEDE